VEVSVRDVVEDSCMSAYEDMIRHTATADAPWYVMPADHTWFAHLVVADSWKNSIRSLPAGICKRAR
jgi:polyphosphate kinase 2 (PPK2 family)